MKRHPILAVFLAVQFVGISCLTLWEHVPSAIGAPMWGTAMILLFPGNFLGGWVVEALFWQKGFSLTAIGALLLIVALTINAIIWFVVVKATGAIRRSFFLRNAKPSR